jgi:hypothetical protein
MGRKPASFHVRRFFHAKKRIKAHTTWYGELESFFHPKERFDIGTRYSGATMRLDLMDFISHRLVAADPPSIPCGRYDTIPKMVVVMGAGISVGSTNHTGRACSIVMVVVGGRIFGIVDQNRPSRMGKVVGKYDNGRCGFLSDQGMVLDTSVIYEHLDSWGHVEFAMVSTVDGAQKLD